MSDRVDLQEFIGGFVAEAEELVASSHTLLVEIEAANAEGTVRPKAVRDLFRALHTIKGLAGMVGVQPIVEIAHALETLLRIADRSGGKLRPAGVEVSLQGVQAIGERVRAVADQRTPAPAPEALLVRIAAADEGAAAAPEPPPVAPEWDARLGLPERQHLMQALRAAGSVFSLSFVPSDDNAQQGISIAVVRTRLSALGDIIKVAPRTLSGDRKGVAFDFLIHSAATPAELAVAAATTADAVISLTPPPPPPEVVAPEAVELPVLEISNDITPLGRAVVRVELSRLDELQEQLSLLIVSRFRLEREISAQAERGLDVRKLREISELQARQLRDLRRAILRVRMVRVAEVLEPLALLVRSMTRIDHKEIRLVIEAHNTEVDKAVADRLLPALIHLVRNAIDHAIEPVAERLAAGKDRAGTLRVSCREHGGSELELIVADDGRGIDRASIEKRAKRPIETDEDLLDVLTTPGFSTRDVVSQTSGRGLGMDIVKRVAVSELGGELSVSTVRGQGTTFRLEVPLTIAIIDVFSFECGAQAFVVPVAAIEEIFEIERSREVTPPARSDERNVIMLLERRGRPIPVISLDALLDLERGARGDGARKAMVIRRNGDPIAFAIDRMLGRHEVVVRPITDPLAQAPGIAGATDLGDGRPTLVLDLFELGARVAAREGRA